MSRIRVVVLASAAVLVLVAIVVLSRAQEDPYARPPLDPRGTGPSGTAAAVELLRARGATVTLGGRPGPDDDVVVQLADRWSGEPLAGLRRWVADGGTLVVADPFAALAPEAGGVGPVAARRPGDCEVRALADLDDVGSPLPTPFPVRPGSSSCFTARSAGRDTAAVDVRRLHRGLVVAVSTTAPFTNDGVGRGDGAVLVVALTDARPGTRIRILDPGRLVDAYLQAR